MDKMMLEDHWDTRQDYIKQGNELAALEAKQEQEKKEQEKALKEMQDKMTTVNYQTNNASSSSGELNPIFVPQKQESRSTSEPNPSFVPQSSLTSNRNGGELGGMRTLENHGRMGFQNNAQATSFQRPFGQNSNPFQNNNGRF